MIESIRHFLELGGPPAWMILFTGAALIAIGLERLYFLFARVSVDSRRAVATTRAAVLEGNYTKALQICNSEGFCPELSVLKSGLLAVENGREAMKSALSGAILQVSRACETRLSYLSLIASASTLLGLFGTITGLIKTFAAMASADAGEKARLLGAGISEAMYCTAAGLMVGIAAMAVHTICLSKTDSIVARVQKSGLNLITWIEQSERSRKVG